MTNLNSLRKAAILVSTLDSASADRLLDQMGEELASRVRNAVLDLDEIPLREQNQVIAEFLRGSGNAGLAATASKANGAGADVEIELSAAAEQMQNSLLAKGASDQSEKSSDTTDPTSHFDFLRQIPVADLTSVLALEQPQVIAVVVSQLSPEQAAEVLERLPADVSTEALARMAWLDELDNGVIADLAAELQAKLAPYQRPTARRANPARIANVSAVLSALGGGRRNQLVQGLAAKDQRLVRQLGYLPESSGHRSDRVTAEAKLAQAAYQRHARFEEQPVVPSEPAETIPFDELWNLSNSELKQVLAAVPSEVAVVALTGAQPRLIQRIAQQQSPAAAKAFHQQLNHPGPLRLQDITLAQQQIAIEMTRLFAEDEPAETD